MMNGFLETARFSGYPQMCRRHGTGHNGSVLFIISKVVHNGSKGLAGPPIPVALPTSSQEECGLQASYRPGYKRCMFKLKRGDKFFQIMKDVSLSWWPRNKVAD
jgi:hypothetical protein